MTGFLEGKVVAITGSVGKTTTKEMLRTVLATFGSVHAAEASYNNHWGLPLTLARMPADSAFGVLEIGMNHPGEIAPLTLLARPHVAAIPQDLQVFSKELCGGTHLSRTGEIGYFKVVSESSVASGVRRIEAITGRAYEQFEANLDREARAIAQGMNTSVLRVATQQDSLAERVERLLTQNQELQRKVQGMERELSKQSVGDLLAKLSEPAPGVHLLAARTPAATNEALREMVDLLRGQAPDAILVLGALVNDRPSFIAAVPKPLVDRGFNAGNLIREVATVAGGKGGGRPELAQAGATDPTKLDEALQAAAGIVRKQAGG